jgi:PAS domain-containing protein
LTVQRAISGERLPSRIELEQQFEGQLDVQAIGVSVNQLLSRAARTAGREKSGPKLFTELGERIHEAVLVHRDVILYANSQFASFVGVDRVDLIDRKLRTWSPPNTPTWWPRICAAASPARTVPTASKWRWSGCRARSACWS